MAVPLRTVASAEALSVGIATVAALVGSMGIAFATVGDFREACTACFNGLSATVKQDIENLVEWQESKLIMTAFVASQGFQIAWNEIQAFFNRSSIDIPAASDTAQLFPSTVNKNNIPVSNSSRLNISFPSGVKYLPNANASYDFTLYNGDVISFRSVYESWSAAGTSRFTLFINDVFQSSYGAAYPSFICPVQYGNSLFICLFSNNHYEYSLGDSIPPIWSGKVSELDWGEDTHIPISNDASAIPQDAVYDGWKAKSTSAGGISLDREKVGVLTEVFGDATTAEDAMTITQADTLVDTGVIEGIDVIKYPIIDNYKAVSGDLTLKDVFPFCIPFDMVDMVTGFRATREAPHIQWRLHVPNIVDYTFDIDMSDYENVAQILRTMELICFCVALAFATRHIIRS